jgi:hypothetical protein
VAIVGSRLLCFCNWLKPVVFYREIDSRWKLSLEETSTIRFLISDYEGPVVIRFYSAAACQGFASMLNRAIDEFGLPQTRRFSFLFFVRSWDLMVVNRTLRQEFVVCYRVTILNGDYCRRTFQMAKGNFLQWVNFHGGGPGAPTPT